MLCVRVWEMCGSTSTRAFEDAVGAGGARVYRRRRTTHDTRETRNEKRLLVQDGEQRNLDASKTDTGAERERESDGQMGHGCEASADRRVGRRADSVS